MSRRYFGTDGIRGLANSAPMTSETALKVGMAAGKLFSSGAHRHRVVIGKDTRLSGYMIESALMSGFTAVGMDVFLLGPMPTPGGRHAHPLAARRPRRDDLGLAQPLRRQRHQAVRSRRLQALRRGRGPDRGADGGAGRELLAPAERIGRAKRIESAQERYIEYAKRTLARNIRLNDLRVVIDCANGAGYQVAPDALWELGARSSRSASSPTATTSTTNAARLRRRRSAPRCGRCAPTSASRSTATPTVS
jgi:phosphoglucosamine mutase